MSEAPIPQNLSEQFNSEQEALRRGGEIPVRRRVLSGLVLQYPLSEKMDSAKVLLFHRQQPLMNIESDRLRAAGVSSLTFGTPFTYEVEDRGKTRTVILSSGSPEQTKKQFGKSETPEDQAEAKRRMLKGMVVEDVPMEGNFFVWVRLFNEEDNKTRLVRIESSRLRAAGAYGGGSIIYEMADQGPKRTITIGLETKPAKTKSSTFLQPRG